MEKLEYPQRESIFSRLKDNSKAGSGFFLLIILSVVITTLGLLINSAAVIIGGMIVSPLLHPIMAVGAAVIKGDEKLLQKSLVLTIRSTVIAVLIALVVSLLSPLKEHTAEILSRTQPTIIDLVIAIASGAAGAYAVAVKDRYASLIGVVISAALIPPLAITGYGLAIGEFDLLMGAFLLYLANLIAIIFSTVVVFYLLGFRPGRSKEDKEEARRDVGVTIGLLLIMAMILSTFLVSTVQQARQKNSIESEIRTFLQSYTDTELIEVEYRELADQLLVKATIQGPSGFTQTAVSILDERLEAALSQDVNLQILYIPVTKLLSEVETQKLE